MDDFKFSAELIQHIPLSLRVRYVFCTAPINKKQPFVCSSLLQVSLYLYILCCFRLIYFPQTLFCYQIKQSSILQYEVLCTKYKSGSFFLTDNFFEKNNFALYLGLHGSLYEEAKTK